MDPGKRPPPRKVRFTPKAPRSSPSSRAIPPRNEREEEDAESQAQYLLGRFNENQRRQKPKDEKKPPVQVAFGPGAPPSSSIKKFGAQRKTIDDKSSNSMLEKDTFDDEQLASPSTAKDDIPDLYLSDSSDDVASNTKKEYIEPWDYNTNYPIILPLRRPYSGDPELLDEAEFGNSTGNLEYDENIIKPALDLGLLEEGDKQKIFFTQFPHYLPTVKQPSSTKEKEKAEISTSSKSAGEFKKGCYLGDLSVGHLGKMLVYKSGAVKLKLGETLFDIQPGSTCEFEEYVAAINTAEEHCCNLGKLGKRMNVVLDVDSALDII